MIIKINLKNIVEFGQKRVLSLIFGVLISTSVVFFLHYLNNGLGLSYNDARSHLDIGRRVVGGLSPGLAQLGSVWLPLPHILMIPTVWNDWFWHSGLSGSIQSMLAFVATGLVIYKILELFKVPLFERIIGVGLWIANVNILYLQSTAMTELLLMGTMTIAVYYLLKWLDQDRVVDLVKLSAWVMFSTLIRYDGWFLFLFCGLIVGLSTLIRRGYKTSEGTIILFSTLAAAGIIGWFLWNQLIFKDALYFVLGPYSAHAQQAQLASAGVLATKGNLLLSLKIYLYAFFYNTYTITALLAAIGFFSFILDKKIKNILKIGSLALLVPFVFNVVALYFGHSVLYLQGIIGGTWFNVRYGILMAPAVAIFVTYLISRLNHIKWVIIGLLAMVIFFAFSSNDAVTIDDATVGSSQKNVTEVSGWLRDNATLQDGFVLISAASHDAIIFSSGLPMGRFIHEGTGAYWTQATTMPDRWARWIIMRTYDNNDSTWRLVSQTEGFKMYEKIKSYPFADIYQLK